MLQPAFQKVLGSIGYLFHSWPEAMEPLRPPPRPPLFEAGLQFMAPEPAAKKKKAMGPGFVAWDVILQTGLPVL